MRFTPFAVICFHAAASEAPVAVSAPAPASAVNRVLRFMACMGACDAARSDRYAAAAIAYDRGDVMRRVLLDLSGKSA